MGWLTILVEIFGGLAVLLGALVPLAGIPMAAVLLVAMITVHLPYGFSSIKLQAVTAAGAQFGPPVLNQSPLPRVPRGPRLGRLRTLSDRRSLAKRREVARASSHAQAIGQRRAAGGADESKAQGEETETHAPD